MLKLALQSVVKLDILREGIVRNTNQDFPPSSHRSYSETQCFMLRHYFTNWLSPFQEHHAPSCPRRSHQGIYKPQKNLTRVGNMDHPHRTHNQLDPLNIHILYLPIYSGTLQDYYLYKTRAVHARTPQQVQVLGKINKIRYPARVPGFSRYHNQNRKNTSH